ncbi:signal recognition particle receptor subunit alpha [Candidatus Woesearchaeota archaeon]|nr:signal recognition particle receptor subunit alpha [Candidatus Woesearchaeota archaeon]
MVLDKLSSSLKSTLQKVTKALFVDDKLINELVKDIQRSLLQADVSVRLVMDITKRIKERALKEKEAKGLDKKEQLITIVYEELSTFLGGEHEPFAIPKGKKPFTIMLVGLFGNGKTTTAGKLANYYKKRGSKVAVVQTDTWRPAAYDQLQTLAKQVDVDFYGEKKAKNPEDIYAKHQQKLTEYDLVIVDTAGRDALSQDLVEELEGLNKKVQADERWLVMAADVGQSAQQQAQQFHDTANVTGVVITKMDGTAKGGGALTACSVTGAPVRFIGVGEKTDDVELFNPKGFVGRLLGMGDLEALLDKAKAAISDEEAEDLGKRFLKGEFNLIDLYEQMQAMKKMGPLSKVMEMVPGMSQLKMPKEALQGQQEKLELWRHLMDSMTKEELEDPDIIRGDRLERIATGAGMPVSELRGLLKQYKQSKKMMKMMKGGGSQKDMQKMMQRMGGKGMKF